MPNFVKNTGRFHAKDENGKKVEVLIYTTFIDASSMDGEHYVEGLKELRVAGGGLLNYEDKGRFRDVLTGKLLTSDDPNAP